MVALFVSDLGIEGGIRLALTLALSTRWRVVTLVWLTCSAKEAAGAEGFLEWGV